MRRYVIPSRSLWRGALDKGRAEIVAWVGSQMLPHESDVRRWLRKRVASDAAIDDIVQEAYCRVAALSSIAHIDNGRAYFFRAVSSIFIDQLRRARVVRIDSVTEIGSLNVVDEEPSPERVVSARRDLARVKRLIEDLPAKCRRIMELRRIDGLPQREVAERLGVTENVVEAQSIRGLRLVMKALEDEGASDVAPRRLFKLGGRDKAGHER